ncbi:MAG: lectin like domain-containing protein [Roseburia sp.]|uniref:lectin like domain-containing protein n=1 Tax=Roseburia sp. 831b TaxID=1261635 RepID=UPI0009523457|nr:lectin like domain-containing protein [Roseburia sp. 831b]MDD6216772.1 lectin like domain-containing protein [Roseburia sp.]WVK72195.1 lectin like domain-containing protein [Roseburia sp. 831b]
MRYSKRYIVFYIFLAIAFFVKFNTIGKNYEEVDEFRGANLEKTVWNPLIAESVNDNRLSVVIDNKEYSNTDNGFFMDDNLNIMAPVSLLRDALNCSAHIYNDNTLFVEKHTSEISFKMEEDFARVNGTKEKIESPLVQKDGEYYVSLSDLSKYLDYSYSWNIEENTASTADQAETTSVIPASYDLRSKERVSVIKDQGTYGTCWAFAGLSAMESVLLPEESEQFSVDHMTLNNHFNLTQDDGGEYTMGMAYLAAWEGPVYEKDDPYGDGVTDDTLKPVKHVQEIQVIDGKDYEKIKEAVFKYGGVQSSLYSALKSSQSKSAFYNSNTNAYCYIGTEKPNHDVVIIGWDDNYSKDNFSVDLEGDGAFICQNSWGTSFGDQGIFYVSYYDTNIGTHNVVYTGIEDVDNYDHIYQSDICGWVGQLGYNKESIYGANVFTAQGKENLTAASFYATGKDSEYELYVVNNFEDENSFKNMKKVAEGSLKNAGYYTIDFSEEIPVEAGERYAVCLRIKTPNAVHPLAIEYAADKTTASVDLTDGEGYISASGSKWVDVNTIQKCNLCIKAFSNNR